MGLEAPNPQVTRVGEKSWELEIVTYGGCQLLRTDTEALHRGQKTRVFPYEIRKICPDRVRRIALHEVALSYRGDGPWAVLIMGESGVQWRDTLSVGGWDPR